MKSLLKNKSGKKKQNFCKYLFSSNYDLVLISFFFLFSSFFFNVYCFFPWFDFRVEFGFFVCCFTKHPYFNFKFLEIKRCLKFTRFTNHIFACLLFILGLFCELRVQLQPPQPWMTRIPCVPTYAPIRSCQFQATFQ